ncbi:hypothetical protein QJS66_03450 [Kocuria rhizophila]|nr:hypothetical protein QJS66_03450 [Kocuria rhizophila]
MVIGVLRGGATPHPRDRDAGHVVDAQWTQGPGFLARDAVPTTGSMVRHGGD